MMSTALLLLAVQTSSSDDWRRAALEELEGCGYGFSFVESGKKDKAAYTNQVSHVLRGMAVLSDMSRSGELLGPLLALAEASKNASDTLHGSRVGWSTSRYTPSLAVNPHFSLLDASAKEMKWHDSFERTSQSVLRDGRQGIYLSKKSPERGLSGRLQTKDSLVFTVEASEKPHTFEADLLASTLQNDLVLIDEDGNWVEPLLGRLAKLETWTRLSWMLPPGKARQYRLAFKGTEPGQIWIDEASLSIVTKSKCLGWSGSAEVKAGQGIIQSLELSGGTAKLWYELIFETEGGEILAEALDSKGKSLASIRKGGSVVFSIPPISKKVTLRASANRSGRVKRLDLKQMAASDAGVMLGAIAEASEKVITHPASSSSHQERARKLLEFVTAGLDSWEADWVVEGKVGCYMYPNDSTDYFPGASLPVNLQSEFLSAWRWLLPSAPATNKVQALSAAIKSAMSESGWQYQSELIPSRRMQVRALSRDPDDASHGNSTAHVIDLLSTTPLKFFTEKERKIVQNRLKVLLEEIQSDERISQNRPLIWSWLRFASSEQRLKLIRLIEPWRNSSGSTGFSIQQKAEMARLLAHGNLQIK